MADQAESIQMIIANMESASALQFIQTAGIRAETNEMNAISEASLHVIEIVADKNNAILGQMG